MCGIWGINCSWVRQDGARTCGCWSVVAVCRGRVGDWDGRARRARVIFAAWVARGLRFLGRCCRVILLLSGAACARLCGVRLGRFPIGYTQVYVSACQVSDCCVSLGIEVLDSGIFIEKENTIAQSVSFLPVASPMASCIRFKSQSYFTCRQETPVAV